MFIAMKTLILFAIAVVGVQCAVISNEVVRSRSPSWHTARDRNNNNIYSQLRDNNNKNQDAIQQQQMQRHESYDINADVVAAFAAEESASSTANRSDNVAEDNENDASEFDVADDVKDYFDDNDGIISDMLNETMTVDTHRYKRELSDWLIAPNTRWCGKGNTANGTYNHLGGAAAADKCCRKHDHCQFQIPAMSNRYNLFNYRPYTLSHCQCDRRFHTCLKMSSDADADTIGQLFFNMMQTDCFVVRQEKVCMERGQDGECRREEIKRKAYARNNRRY